MALRTVVLASASTSRLGLLRAAGVQPVVVRSGVDEDIVTDQFWAENPTAWIGELAKALAIAKGEDVVESLSSELSDAVVVACDSVLEWHGLALGKPGSAEAATARLVEMSGTSGVLHTGHFVFDGLTSTRRSITVSTQVGFAHLGADEIAAYVRTGEPIEVAGSFTLDGLSSPFITGVVGDPSNVIGLSLPTLRIMLTDMEVPWLDVVDYA